MLEFYLKDAEVSISAKGRLVIVEREKETQLQAKTEAEMLAWYAEFHVILGQFSDIPVAQEVCTIFFFFYSTFWFY